MDTVDSDIYDYDRSSFFRLLQSSKYRLKYEFIQQQQGLVVCPLKLKYNPRLIKQSETLIESHLFVPSPFYKNHFIPLNSLKNLSTLNQNSITHNSLPLDHSQKISLVLNTTDNELIVMSNRRRICKHVKLLNIQAAYTDNCKSYKIVIVNTELHFKVSTVLQPSHHSSNNSSSKPDRIDEKFEDSDSETMCELDKQVNATFENYHQNGREESKSNLESNFTSSFDSKLSGVGAQMVMESVPGVSYRNSTYMEEVTFSSVNDVRTFGSSVDFMHSSSFLDSFVDDEQENNSDENASRKVSSRQSKKIIQAGLIGENLVNEIEVLRKTYIILYTHIVDCEKQLERIYLKYLRKFLRYAQTLMNLDTDSGVYSDFDLMVSVACENIIVGVVFSKLWPCLLQLNMNEDDFIQIKCDRIRKLLKLTKVTNLTAETIDLCSRFFHIETKYFLINTQPVLREFKRLSLLNNPFEKLECIKSSVELVTNELTILSSQPKDPTKHTSQDNDGKEESTIITSEILIPLISFILIRSNINCFKSICYFIDTFQFSSRPNSFSNSHCSTRLGELAFFMTTFKAAIQFIETSC